MADPTLPPLRCPTCGGAAIVYTCEPTCCFNHVCEACRTTFQPRAEAIGGALPGLSRHDHPGGMLPTVACGECRALAVWQLGDDLACTACGARLELVYEDVDGG